MHNDTDSRKCSNGFRGQSHHKTFNLTYMARPEKNTIRYSHYVNSGKTLFTSKFGNDSCTFYSRCFGKLWENQYCWLQKPCWLGVFIGNNQHRAEVSATESSGTPDKGRVMKNFGITKSHFSKISRKPQSVYERRKRKCMQNSIYVSIYKIHQHKPTQTDIFW